MSLALSFAEALKRRWKALDLTQQELAQQVGCAAVTIQRIEQGTLRPSRQVAQRLAAILAIPADEREPFVHLARGVPAEDAPQALSEQPLDAAPVPSLLPTPLTPLIGRVQEVATVRETLASGTVRLLTLTGPGGIGKTRLALQVAAEMVAAFADGAAFVDLAPIGDPELVASSIAQVLGLHDLGSQPLIVTLQRYLRDRHLLLVLDNFEQVVRAAPLVAELLAAAPQLKVLLTSRVVVGVYGEHTFLVLPLTLPNLNALPPHDQLLEVEAVRLFVERAQATRPDFRLTEVNIRTVSEICHRLDGLPLALELAAARVRLLPPQALLERLSSRLELLRGGPRTLPARQQTLRATIDWSHELLDPEEQRLFRRLAVFVGGWTLEAATEVLSFELKVMNEKERQLKTLEGLAALIDKSLLLQREEADGEPRFTMLETIREYALEQLAASGELEELQRRHTRFFITLTEAAHLPLRGPQQRTWLERLEMEHPNLRAALAWSLQTENLALHHDWENHGQRAELGLRLAVALSRFWERRGYLSEGREWLAHAVSRTTAGGASGPLIAVYRALRAKALVELAPFAYRQDDLAAAQSALEEGLALFQELGDSEGMASALNSLGMLLHDQGDYGRGGAFLEEGLILYRKLGHTRGIAWSLFFLGMLAYTQGNVMQANELWEESLIQLRAQGDLGGIALLLTHVGMGALNQGDYGRAGTHLTESLILSRDLGYRWQTAHTLEVVAGLVAAQEQRPADAQQGGLRAGRLFGAAEALRETLGAPPLVMYRDHYQHGVAAARAELDEVAFAAAWVAGRAMPLEQAIAEARAISGSSER